MAGLTKAHPNYESYRGLNYVQLIEISKVGMWGTEFLPALMESSNTLGHELFPSQY